MRSSVILLVVVAHQQRSGGDLQLDLAQVLQMLAGSCIKGSAHRQWFGTEFSWTWLLSAVGVGSAAVPGCCSMHDWAPWATRLGGPRPG